MSATVIREAKAQDYNGVLDMGVFYDGFDYIPYFYHRFLNDPDYLCYVCEVEGKIVGYVCGLIHDGGRMLQARAGRVMPEYQGKGLASALYQRLGRDAYMNKAKVFTYSIFEVDWAKVSKSAEHIDAVHNVYFKIPRPDTYTRPASMVRLNEELFGSILASPAACHTLFPRGLMYVHFLALGLDKSNIRHIINEDTSVFAIFSTGGNSAESKFLPENIRSLSVGIRYLSPIGQICDIIFHGTYLEDFDDHVSAQLDEIKNCEAVTVGLYVPLVCPLKILENKEFEIYSKLCGETGSYMEDMLSCSYFFKAPIILSSKY